MSVIFNKIAVNHNKIRLNTTNNINVKLKAVIK